MAIRSQAPWYVSFELTKLRSGKRDLARATETFRSELEAYITSKALLVLVGSINRYFCCTFIGLRRVSCLILNEWVAEFSP